jgi:hypothetical protein
VFLIFRFPSVSLVGCSSFCYCLSLPLASIMTNLLFMILLRLSPSPTLLARHFFTVAFYSIWCMWTHPLPVVSAQAHINGAPNGHSAAVVNTKNKGNTREGRSCFHAPVWRMWLWPLLVWRGVLVVCIAFFRIVFSYLDCCLRGLGPTYLSLSYFLLHSNSPFVILIFSLFPSSRSSTQHA